MNKIINTAILFFFVQSVIAQKGIDNLIKTEKDFAAYSVAHSTKEAFRQFIDSNSIMFEEGKPVKAIDYWNKREKRSGVLNWQPQFAEIAASGDWGYTTGPWTFQNSIKDSVVARGQYTTVWHKNKNGEWKFIVDLGVANSPLNLAPGVKKITIPKVKSKPMHHAPILNVEDEFIKKLNKNKDETYQQYLSSKSVLSRNNHLPAVDSKEQKSTIDSTPLVVTYNRDSWGISTSLDMGYVYGTTIINGKTENYLRIWRREKEGWKIAVEVLRY